MLEVRRSSYVLMAPVDSSYNWKTAVGRALVRDTIDTKNIENYLHLLPSRIYFLKIAVKKKTSSKHFVLCIQKKSSNRSIQKIQSGFPPARHSDRRTPTLTVAPRAIPWVSPRHQVSKASLHGMYSGYQPFRFLEITPKNFLTFSATTSCDDYIIKMGCKVDNDGSVNSHFWIWCKLIVFVTRVELAWFTHEPQFDSSFNSTGIQKSVHFNGDLGVSMVALMYLSLSVFWSWKFTKTSLFLWFLSLREEIAYLHASVRLVSPLGHWLPLNDFLHLKKSILQTPWLPTLACGWMWCFKTPKEGTYSKPWSMDKTINKTATRPSIWQEYDELLEVSKWRTFQNHM